MTIDTALTIVILLGLLGLSVQLNIRISKMEARLDALFDELNSRLTRVEESRA